VSNFVIRSATPTDIPALWQLIQALADYEHLSHAVTGTPEQLAEHLFGARPYAEVLVAEVAGQVVGQALFFYSYSTFLTQPGIYLEDLFVLPEHRGAGLGKALLLAVADLAVARGCGRFEWSVLDWNESAIGFYQKMGAVVLPDWRICRVDRERLLKMGESVGSNC
jgi:GNAT superfamily N-acetyltransferase